MYAKIVRRGTMTLVLGLVSVAPAMAQATEDGALSPAMQALIDARPARPAPLAPLHATPCVGGFAAGYPCSNIDLLAFVPVADFSAASTNSLWGWTDPQSGIEYALIGANNGVAFYDLSQPTHPRYVGKLPTHTGNSLWRDVRVHANHAYVVSDNNASHGLQVFDLTRLRGVTAPQTFTENAHRDDFGRGHTIGINTDTGYAYVAGSNTCAAPTATGALRIYDLANPAAPAFVGCVPTGGYTHESQCFTYHGPDTAHTGKEVCLNANGPTDRFAIVDVTVKSAPVTLSSIAYAGAGYPHQAWFTEDHAYALLNDELDETTFGHNAQTLVFDVKDLDAPVLVGRYDHGKRVIDHNLYVHGQYVYESNYESGLRILRLDNLSQAQMTEVAYFDVYPGSDNAEFNGSWNNYRFPGSGNVIATSIDEGFFVLEPQLCAATPAPSGVTAAANGDHRIDVGWSGSGTPGALWRVERAQGGCGGSFQTIADNLATPAYSDAAASGAVTYGYRVVERNATGQCVSAASTCVQAQTTGSCTAAPLFGGIGSATTPFTAGCRVDLAWNDAAPACGGPARYAVHRSATPGFTPSPANRIANAQTDAGYADTAVPSGVARYYVVRSTDATNNAEDANTVELAATAFGPNVDGTLASGAEPGDPPFDSGSGSLVLESGNSVRHAGWHTSLTRVHGGEQSFWSTAANNLCVSLVTQDIELTAAQAPKLAFWSVWDIEPGPDGGVIEVSSDHGTTWTRLTPSGGYPGSITSGGALCGIAQGAPAFSGLAHFTWTQHEVDLSAYAGQSVQLRWLYRTDAANAKTGWFVDDVAITHAQVPGSCASGVDAIFADGFDP